MGPSRSEIFDAEEIFFGSLYKHSNLADRILTNQDAPRLTAILTGSSTISDMTFHNQSRLLKIFASFVDGHNKAQFLNAMPWLNLVNMPPVLVRSEMIQSKILKAAVNTMLGRSSQGREIAEAATVTGKLFLRL